MVGIVDTINAYLTRSSIGIAIFQLSITLHFSPSRRFDFTPTLHRLYTEFSPSHPDLIEL